MAGTFTRTREGALLGGRYSLRERIGSGGMASVWLAEDVTLGREVAVKVLAEALAQDDDFLMRFRREARIAAAMAHPNLVSVFDFDPDAAQPYLVMEFVPGPNLAVRLERGDSIRGDRIAGDILSALAAIHRAGVIHRDVKPANVLIAPGGHAMLTDFGIARPQDATSITQAGLMPGTRPYMAPELLEGKEASPRSDLYSCGVLIGEVLQGDRSTLVGGLADRLADRDPDRRPQSAEAALGELPRGSVQRVRVPFEPDLPTEAAEAEAAVTRPVAVMRSAGRDRSRLMAVGALGAIVALVLLIVALSGGSDSPEREGAKQRAEQAQPEGGDEQPSQGGESERPADPEGAAGEPPAPSSAPDPEQAAALNDQGFSLIQAGRSAEAVPILRRSVELFGDNTGDINYAFALFNLGQALNDAGRPAEAVPVLQERLQIPNQTETVRAELAAALAALGGSKPPKPKKVPPGQAKR